MTDPPPELLISHCRHCHGRFLPRSGPCPRCGSTEVVGQPVPPTATVLAATELLAPAAGWSAPHRLALVQAPEEVRILARVDGPLPKIGAEVTVARERDGYVVRSAAARP